jgi:cytochrome c oxidase assembly factor CtaG
MVEPVSVVLTVALAVLAVAYGWSWRSARDRISLGRVSAFIAGLVSLWAAVASPLAHLDQGQLTAHMIQHLLIMTVAAPLLLLGEPAFVFLNALPERLRRRPLGRRSPHPALCWFAGTFVVLAWHVPTLFEVGMRWHGAQHATFLVAGLLFWVPVIQPWPTVARWPRWSIPPYLFLATLPCDALSAFLAFYGRVVYPRYCSMASHVGISPLDDQGRAGALMWLWVTIAYLVPAALVTIELLSPSQDRSGK